MFLKTSNPVGQVWGDKISPTWASHFPPSDPFNDKTYLKYGLLVVGRNQFITAIFSRWPSAVYASRVENRLEGQTASNAYQGGGCIILLGRIENLQIGREVKPRSYRHVVKQLDAILSI